MSVLIASKYWIHYLSVPEEPPREANGSRINWSVQGSLLPVTVLLLCHWYVQDRRVKVFWDQVISAQHLSAYHPPFAWLLELLLYSQWHYCSLSEAAKCCYKKHWSQVLLKNSLTKVSDFLFCFLNFMLICGDGDITWECTPLQENLTRKGLSGTGIWRDIPTPD